MGHKIEDQEGNTDLNKTIQLNYKFSYTLSLNLITYKILMYTSHTNLTQLFSNPHILHQIRKYDYTLTYFRLHENFKTKINKLLK